MQIHRLATLNDNYTWVITQNPSVSSDPTQTSADSKHPKQSAQPCYVVDPGEAQPVIDFCQTHDLSLAGILITHHHPDHTDGVKALLSQCNACPVYGFADGPAGNLITNAVLDNDCIDIFGKVFTVIETPGHSLDHVCFYHPTALFSGDVLFAGGCGKIWDHPPELMHQSLMTLRALDDDCQVYCGHEYTYENMMFAHIAEPDNDAIDQRLKQVRAQRQQDQATVPSTLGLEKATNPFLRYDLSPLKQPLEARQPALKTQHDPVEYFAQLRAWKDTLDATGALKEGLNDA